MPSLRRTEQLQLLTLRLGVGLSVHVTHGGHGPNLSSTTHRYNIASPFPTPMSSPLVRLRPSSASRSASVCTFPDRVPPWPALPTALDSLMPIKVSTAKMPVHSTNMPMPKTIRHPPLHPSSVESCTPVALTDVPSKLMTTKMVRMSVVNSLGCAGCVALADSYR